MPDDIRSESLLQCTNSGDLLHLQSISLKRYLILLPLTFRAKGGVFEHVESLIYVDKYK